MREVMRGHALQHGGGSCFKIHGVGQRYQAGGGHGRIFRVGAAMHGVGDAVAGFDFGHIRPHGLDHARGLVAGSEWQIGLVKSGAEVNVDEVDARRGNFDERLFGSRRRDGRVDELQFFRATGLRNTNQFHVFLTNAFFRVQGALLLRACAVKAYSSRKITVNGKTSKRAKVRTAPVPESPMRTSGKLAYSAAFPR